MYLRARYYDPVIGRFTQQDTTLARKRNFFDSSGHYQEVVFVGGKFVDAKQNQYIVNDPLSLNLYTYCHNSPLMFVDPTGNVITPANVVGALIGAGIGALLGAAIADHFNLTGWARGVAIAGGSLLVGIAGWFAGPAVLKIATNVAMSAITSGKLALTSLSAGVINAMNLGQRAAQNAVQGVSNFAVSAKHLLGAGGTFAQFASNSTATINQWVSQGLSTANNFVVNSGDSFYTVVNMGQAVGSKGEQFIKIVFTVGGKIITAYPVVK